MNNVSKTMLVAAVFGAIAVLASVSETATARDAAPRVTPLFSTGKTVMDEPIVYPSDAPAKLTGAIIEMAPGQETGWHTHSAPLAGIVLEGELTVDYGARGKRVYRQGEALAEAIAVPHNGKNTGLGPMRLFALTIGAEGLPASTPAPAPTAAAP